MRKNSHTLVVGTSELALELAKTSMKADNSQVWIAGRCNPKIPGLPFKGLEVARHDLSQHFSELIDGRTFPSIQRLIYCAGPFQAGQHDRLSQDSIHKTMLGSFEGALHMVRLLLRKQTVLECFVAVNPIRESLTGDRGVVYSAAIAALRDFALSLSTDSRVGKVLLVAAPENSEVASVAELTADQIIAELNQDFRYRDIRIHS